MAFKCHAKIFLALICFAWACQPAWADNTPVGWWLDHTGKAGIEILRCGGSLCGKIEWLRVPLDSTGKPKTDSRNPDVALRGRTLCGLSVLGGFVSDGEGGWRGGWVYDPENGKTYHCIMYMATDGVLHVRGYVGIPLLGRSEVWTRPAMALAPCAGG